MLWRVCRKWADAYMEKYVRLRCFHFHQCLWTDFNFTKLSANVERVVCFVTVYSSCDGLIKGHCYGNSEN